MNISLENKCMQDDNIKDCCNEIECCNEKNCFNEKDCCNEIECCNEKVEDVKEALDVSETLDPDIISETIYEAIFDTSLDLLQVDPLIDNSNSILDIEIPQFPVKINVNNVDEIPSLDELLAANVNVPNKEHNPKNLSYDEMQNIMHDIENTVNFKSVSESMHALNNHENILFSRIQNAFDTFKEKTGRNMTYSEMRYMMG